MTVPVLVLTLAATAAAQSPPVVDPLLSPFDPADTGRPSSSARPLELLTGERSPESASDEDELETDRDSFTPATTIVSRRRLIVEAAYSFLDNRGFKDTHSLPELLLRYGLTDRIELRFGWNYEVGGIESEINRQPNGNEPDPSAGRLVRESTLQYGIKVRATDQDGWVPQSVVIIQGLTPTGGSAGTSTGTDLLTAVVAGWELRNRWRFDTAFRYATSAEADDRFNVWAPSAVLRVPIGERWAVHGEYFGILSSGKARNDSRHYFSPGVHWLVTPDLEVGVRLGWGLNDQSARFFSNVGFGWRY